MTKHMRLQEDIREKAYDDQIRNGSWRVTMSSWPSSYINDYLSLGIKNPYVEVGTYQGDNYERFSHVWKLSGSSN